MYQALAYTHAVKNQIKEGTIVVHSARASTVSTHVKEVKDYDNGGCETRDSEPDPATAIGLARADYKKLAVVYLISPNPDADTYLFKVSGKKPKALGAIMLHELGHSLWLQHVAATRTGMPRANAPKPDEHVK